MKIDASDREVKKFGITFAVLFLALAALSYFRHHAPWPWFAAGSLVFLAAGLLAPAVLRPLYAGWMKFASALAWVNTRAVLGIMFYLVFTPIGVIARLIGKDLIDQRIDKGARSYWIERTQEPIEKKRYEQLF